MKIDEIINKHYDTTYADYGMKLSEVKSAMKEYAELYAKKCLEEADSFFDWDHDMEEWCGDYKPSEIDLPSHE